MRIGYYAHQHGSGHCRQADKLAALLPVERRQQMTVFTSLTAEDYAFGALEPSQIVRLSPEHELPEDVLSGRAAEHWHPNSLHYSPVGNRDIQTRSWQLMDGIRQRQIDLMIIDVSAEVAMLCRTASVPYLYVKLMGERDDEPHLNAFAGALGLLAPYPESLECDSTAQWVRQKTLYLGFLSNDVTQSLSYPAFITQLLTLTADHKVREDLVSYLDTFNKTAQADEAVQVNKTAIVTIIKGYGGHEAIDAKLPMLRAALPEALLVSLGPIGEEVRDCVDIAAHVTDVTPFIVHSDLLLMACGLNSIAQAYPHQTPLIVLPDIRPHREQEMMAAALIRQGRALSWAQFLALVSEPSHQDLRATFVPLTCDQRQLTDAKLSTAAKDVMRSLVHHPSAKSWFQQWLLPQLKTVVKDRLN